MFLFHKNTDLQKCFPSVCTDLCFSKEKHRETQTQICRCFFLAFHFFLPSFLPLKWKKWKKWQVQSTKGKNSEKVSTFSKMFSKKISKTFWTDTNPRNTGNPNTGAKHPLEKHRSSKMFSKFFSKTFCLQI